MEPQTIPGDKTFTGSADFTGGLSVNNAPVNEQIFTLGPITNAVDINNGSALDTFVKFPFDINITWIGWEYNQNATDAILEVVIAQVNGVNNTLATNTGVSAGSRSGSANVNYTLNAGQKFMTTVLSSGNTNPRKLVFTVVYKRI